MNSLRVFVDRKTVSLVAVFALLLSLALPIFASAAQVTTRSIALSNSSKGVDDVTYQVKFTPEEAATIVVLDFCTNSPLVGEACTAPAAGGENFSVADVTASGWTDSAVDGNTLKLSAGTVTADTENTITVVGVDNPTTAGTLYVRIVTFDSDTYTSATDLGAGAVDDGSVAVSITDTIGVSGAVLESMLFCVSKAAPGENCTSTDAPVLELGEDSAGVIALTPSALSTGTIYTQISTNAVTGAVVSLKSGVSCGGLKRASAATCDIAAAGTTGTFAANEAKFGVKLAAASGTGVGSAFNGTYQAADGSPYDATNYRLDGTAVAGTYGTPILDTNDLPINNMNMGLTFGASITNNTPAGKYSADLSLIATGKF